jgi:iron complex outermembrane receptor protein
VRGEQRRYRGEAGARDFDLISGSASAFVKPVQGVRLSLSLAKTERAPTEVELFANGPHAATQAFEIGNPTLAKEAATSLELGISWRFKEWRAHVDVWQAEFDGFIGFAPNGEEEDGLAIYEVSQKDATLRGHEFGLSGPLWVGTAAQISADVTGDYVRGRQKGGAFIARMPPPQVTLGLEAQWAKLKARVEAQRLDSQKKLAAFETPTSGANIYNVRLSWQPLGDGDGIALVLEGNNLTDALVREHSSFLKDSVPKPGRSLKLSLHAKF